MSVMPNTSASPTVKVELVEASASFIASPDAEKVKVTVSENSASVILSASAANVKTCGSSTPISPCPSNVASATAN